MTVWFNGAREMIAAENANPDEVLQSAQCAAMLSPLPQPFVCRVILPNGNSAWCKVMGERITCAATGYVEAGSMWDVSHMSDDDFFRGARWPASWMTLGAVKKDMKRAKDAPMRLGGYAWAREPNSEVRLAHVVSVEPLTLQYDPLSLDVISASDTGLSWRSIHEPDGGFALVWQRRKLLHYNFGQMARSAHAAPNAKPIKTDEERQASREARFEKWQAACAAGRERKKAERLGESAPEPVATTRNAEIVPYAPTPHADAAKPADKPLDPEAHRRRWLTRLEGMDPNAMEFYQPPSNVGPSDTYPVRQCIIWERQKLGLTD